MVILHKSQAGWFTLMLLVRTRWGPVCMTGSLRGRHARNGKDSDYASDSDEEYMTSSEFEALAAAVGDMTSSQYEAMDL